jgi:hypothetical protein
MSKNCAACFTARVYMMELGVGDCMKLCLCMAAMNACNIAKNISNLKYS